MYTHTCMNMYELQEQLCTHDFIRFKFQRNKDCLHAEVRLQPYLTQRELVENLRDLGLFPQCSQAGGFMTGLYTTVLPSISLSVSKPYIHVLQCELRYEITGKTRKKENSMQICFGKQFHPVESFSQDPNLNLLFRFLYIFNGGGKFSPEIDFANINFRTVAFFSLYIFSPPCGRIVTLC